MTMGCCREGARQPTRAVSLVFKREQLLYDIGNYAFVEGDVIPAQEEHERHQVMDVTQAGNIDLATRTLNLAHSETEELLYPYTKRPVADGERLDDELEEPEEYVIEMRVPATMSATSLKYLRNLIHDYLVARVLYEWMSLTNLTNRGSKQNWEMKIDGLKMKMKSSALWRIKPLRIRKHPF